MTDPNDDRREEPNDDPQDEEPHWLSSLLRALDRLDRGSTAGQRPTDRSIVDYDISIGTAFDADTASQDAGDSSRDEPAGPRGSLSASPRPDDGRSGPIDADGDRSRTHRRTDSADTHRVTTRSTDDELLVTADVEGIDPDTITVGFDDRELVVAVSGTELDRVSVPWPERSADARINNGVLTVRVTPDESPAQGGPDE